MWGGVGAPCRPGQEAPGPAGLPPAALSSTHVSRRVSVASEWQVLEPLIVQACPGSGPCQVPLLRALCIQEAVFSSELSPSFRPLCPRCRLHSWKLTPLFLCKRSLFSKLIHFLNCRFSGVDGICVSRWPACSRRCPGLGCHPWGTGTGGHSGPHGTFRLCSCCCFQLRGRS